MRDTFLVFGAPAIEDAEIAEVVASLKSGWLGTGPKVARFESDFKAYERAAHAVAVSSCTAALHLSMLALGLQPGDEVITTRAHVRGHRQRHHPRRRHADSGRCRPGDHEHRPGGRAPCGHAPYQSYPAGALRRPRLRDGRAAHHLRGARAGADRRLRARNRDRIWRPSRRNLWRFGCFSFYVTKNVVTGEGGMVLAAREEDASRIKVLALHGMSRDAWKRFTDEGYRHYYVTECGFKYNMTDIQAALGIHQLARVEANWGRRRAIWARYQRELAGLGLGLPAEPEPGTRHALPPLHGHGRRRLLRSLP